MKISEEVEIQAASASEEIGLFLLKWGRVPVRDFKEKYGTVRVYCSLGWNSLHNIFYPGYAYYQFPDWLRNLDIYHGDKILRCTGFGLVSFHFHKFLYRLAYKRALKKYPTIRENIIGSADWPEFLKGL